MFSGGLNRYKGFELRDPYHHVPLTSISHPLGGGGAAIVAKLDVYISTFSRLCAFMS